MKNTIQKNSGKRTAVIVILWTAVVLWMSLIFYFSMENSEKSSQSSNSVIEIILSFADKNFDSYTQAEKSAICEKYSFFIRKTAHFSIYTVLGGLIYAALSYQYNNNNRRKTAVLSFAIGAVYAVSDEIHQYFVPGRACQLRDMLIDSCGVLTGIAVFMLIIKLSVSKNKARKTKQQIPEV